MTVREALFQFWSSFSVPAFEENSVPSGGDFPGFPYITFPMVESSFGDDSHIFVSVWTRSPSWESAIIITDAIKDRLKDGGIYVHYDGGAVCITMGTPFSRGMGDPNDSEVKRMLLDVTLHF